MNMSERGRLGGIARHGTTMAQRRRDVEECQAYLAARRAAGNKTTTWAMWTCRASASP